MADGGNTFTEVDISEVVSLAAIDSRLYGKFFFPKVIRQEYAPFHERMDQILEGPGRRKMLKAFRGSAKTTKTRLFISKRIAYGISRTIVVVGKSEGHAARTVRWLKSQITVNRKWATTFGLVRGIKWTDTECEIVRFLPGMAEPERITVIAIGITGSVRGINVDDYRPDLIVLDDVGDEENCGNVEQREKIEDLIYGALLNSLAPESEEPMACIVVLQTPLDREDFSVKAEKLPSWIVLTIGCWTDETRDLPLDQQESSWPARFSSEGLRAEKLDAIARNKLSTFLREMECKVTDPETCTFRSTWLRNWVTLPKILTNVLVIDPVPPPSPKQIATGNVKKDYEAFGVIGAYAGEFYARAARVNRGHEPNWTISTFWQMYMQFRPQLVIVEAIGYQRVLKWLLSQSMKSRGVYVPILEFADQGSKFNRIVDGMSGPTSHGTFYLPPPDDPEGINHSEGMRQLVQQFSEYPTVSHDDALEVFAVGLSALQGRILIGDEHALEMEKAIEKEDRYYFRHQEEQTDYGLSRAP